MIKETRDRLTGLFVQKYFDGRFEEELARSRRYKHNLTLLLFEVNFKYFLPDYDIRWIMIYTIFRQFGNIVTKDLRTVDIAGRYGVDTFAIMLPETPLVGGKVVAERIRKAVEDHIFEGFGIVPEIRVAVDCGIVTSPINGKTREEMIESAKKALQVSKDLGGNSVKECPHHLYNEKGESIKGLETKILKHVTAPATKKLPEEPKVKNEIKIKNKKPYKGRFIRS